MVGLGNIFPTPLSPPHCVVTISVSGVGLTQLWEWTPMVQANPNPHAKVTGFFEPESVSTR